MTWSPSAASYIRRGRLRWFGYVYKKREEDWVKNVWKLEVTGTRSKRHPKKTWNKTLKTVAQERKLLNLIAVRALKPLTVEEIHKEKNCDKMTLEQTDSKRRSKVSKIQYVDTN